MTPLPARHNRFRTKTASFAGFVLTGTLSSATTKARFANLTVVPSFGMVPPAIYSISLCETMILTANSLP